MIEPEALPSNLIAEEARLLPDREVGIAPDLPRVRLDAILFEQVLFNLLDNAAKYAPAGSRIDLDARRDGDLVVMEVIDEGPGIPPGDLERIFDKFYRVHAQDRQRAGTGLGLAICRGFTEAQGGRISAQNRRARGRLSPATTPRAARITDPFPRSSSCGALRRARGYNASLAAAMIGGVGAGQSAWMIPAGSVISPGLTQEIPSCRG